MFGAAVFASAPLAGATRRRYVIQLGRVSVLRSESVVTVLR